MDFLPPQSAWALPALILLLLGWVTLRLRLGSRQRRGHHATAEALDTVADWPPQAVRVLTVSERQAYELLRRALPGYLVLAQVPLSRFISVPRRHAYIDWVQRVGLLSADLLLCDAGSRVLVVIDIRTPGETPRAQRRHRRMQRVLQAAGVHVLTWYEGELSTLQEVRTLLTPLVGGAAPGNPESTSRPMPLQTAQSLAATLAAGDAAATRWTADESNEPVPSAFFEDAELAPDPR
jgi:hypothetical protein